MTLETSPSADEPRSPPAMPVAALPYHRGDETALSPETKLVVLVAALYGVFGLLSFATYVCIYLQPAYFRTVGGGFRSVRSFEFAIAAIHVIISVVLVAGAAAFYARRPSCRPVLMAGAVGQLLTMVLGFANYVLFAYGRPGVTTVGDRLVMSVWQGSSLVSAALLPVLLLVVMTRPATRALFKKPG